MLLPSLALESGKLPRWVSFLSAQLPRAFQTLKSSASIEGRKWEEPGEKVMSPVPGIPQGGVGRCKTKPWHRREAQQGRACSVLFLKPPWLQVPSTKPSTAPLHLLSLRNVLAVRRSWRDQSNETQKPPHSRKPVGKEGFGWTWCYFICALAIPGSTWLKTQKRKTERAVVALRDLTVAWRAQPGTKVLEREKQAGLPWPGSWRDCQWFIEHIKFPLGFFPFSFSLLLWKWRFHV